VFDTTLGTITNLSGSLRLGTYETNLTGAYSAAAGATIQFIGDNVTPGTPFALNGDGQFQFISGTLNLPAKTIPNLMLVGGYLALGPGFQGGAITNLALDGTSLLSNSLPVTGAFAVTNSTLYGNYPVARGGVFTGTNAYSVGWVTVASGGVFAANGFVVAAPLTVAAGGVANLAGTISLRAASTNAGTITISNAAISPAGIVNQAGGLISFLGGGSSILYNTGSEFFHNYGAIAQNAQGGTNRISIVGFDNAQGTVTNLAGTLQLGIFQTNLAGMFDTAPGAVIQFSGGVVPSQFVGVNRWASPVAPAVWH